MIDYWPYFFFPLLIYVVILMYDIALSLKRIAESQRRIAYWTEKFVDTPEENEDANAD